MAAPNSYKDVFWSDLSAKVEQKLGLPDGLLVGIVTKGERSNADQVSEANAKTPFQIIPATRKAALDKYGIDPYLSPENAAEVAGRLLKDSLDRNKGDAALAVAEYHGGTDRKNWGPRTQAYVKRVVGSEPAKASPVSPRIDPVATDLPASQSTFQRVMASQQQPQEKQIAQVFQAYQSGQMAPEDKAQFESDVKNGLVILPRGAELAATPKPGSMELPAAVAEAYQSGKMSPQDRAELEADIKSGAVTLPQGARVLKPDEASRPMADMIPGAAPGQVAPAATSAPVGNAPTSFVDKAIGTGEAALQMATGATGGALGMAGGAAGALTASILDGSFGTPQAAAMVEDAAAKGAEALTYTPRTQSGQQQSQAVGEAMAQAIPAIPLGGEMAGLSRAAAPIQAAPRAAVRTAANAAVDAVPAPVKAAAASVAAPVRAAAEAIQKPISSVTGKVREALKPSSESRATAGTQGSVGAAGTDVATMRRARAADLDVPIPLSKGQAEKDFGQQRFEREQAKDPGAAGGELRAFAEDQNEKILQNMDINIDKTGATAPTLRAVGSMVDDALIKQMKRDETQIKVAYAKADKSAESRAAVDQNLRVAIGEGDDAITSTPIEYINSQPKNLSSTKLVDAAREYAVTTGVADLVDGKLVPKPGATIKQMETWRKEINNAVDYAPTDIRHATIIKKMIDGQTEPIAGPLYRQARATRQRFAQNYEDRAVINKLVTLKKDSADRKVALEDVFTHSIMDGSLDDVRTVRRVLQRGGEDGWQAWRELQGQTLKTIKEEATKNVTRDSRGNQIVSPAALDKAIRKLDADGKLDFIFGKKGAEKMRDIRDIAMDVYVSTPGAVNTSSTASVLAGLIDLLQSSMTGIPLPVASGLRYAAKNMKDRKLAARVREAIGTDRQNPKKF